MAVYFFYGDEDFLIDSEIESMKSRLNKDFISMSYQTFDNLEYSNLISVLRTPPMMFGDSLYVISADKYFLSQKKFFEDDELSDIEDALDNNPEALNIVFTVKLPRNEGKKLDTRRKLYKILSKYNSEEFQTYKTYKTAEISDWLRRRAHKKDLVLKDEAVNLLIEQLGNDLRKFDIELDKLKLMAYPEKTVTGKMVEDITVSNQDLFNITELIMKNKKDEALLEFNRLTDKKHPLEILAAIQTMLRKWIVLKLKAPSLSNLELARETGMHEFVVKQTLQKLKSISTSELVKLKQNLYEAECKIKSGEAQDINSEVGIAIIR